MHKTIIYFHVFSGALALLVGLFAMLQRKAKGKHTQFGKWYAIFMYCCCASALALSILKWNTFFVAIGFFTFYLVFSGQQAIKFWRLTEEYSPKTKDYILNMVFFAMAFFMVIYPLFNMWKQQEIYVSVLMIFGLIMVSMVFQDFRILREKKHFFPKQKIWLSRHISFISGSYIAAVTAFLVNNITLPIPWVTWILPTVVGSILIAIQQKKYGFSKQS